MDGQIYIGDFQAASLEAGIKPIEGCEKGNQEGIPLLEGSP
jgi:hypothetical protein